MEKTIKIYRKKFYILRYYAGKSIVYSVCTGAFEFDDRTDIVKEFKPNKKGSFHFMGGMITNRQKPRSEKAALAWLNKNKKSEMEILNPKVYFLATSV